MTNKTKTPLQKTTRNSFKKGLMTSLIIAGLTIPNFIPSQSYAGGFSDFFKKLSAPYGQIKANKDITKSFERYELKQDHNYFVSGAEGDETAIMGLHKDFKLGNTKSWRPLNSQKTLQNLVKKMKDEAFDSDNYLDGADIYHNKQDIGDWYSTANTTIVKHKGGNIFSIYAPWKGRGFGGGNKSRSIGGVTGGQSRRGGGSGAGSR